jgi:PAS domain S-box-containing protein
MKELEEQFRILFEQASDGIFVTDSMGRFIDANRAGCKMLGYTKKEITHLTVADILYEYEIERLHTGIEQLIRGEDKRGKSRFKRKDRSVFIGEVSSTKLSDGRMQAIIRDVTEQTLDQEILIKSEERFRQTLDHLLEGCMIVGFDWTYLYLNDAINKGNYQIEDLLGHSMLEMYPGVEKTKLFSYYKLCMEKRIPQNFEESFTFEDGSTIWNNFSVQPVPEGIFVLALDITKQKQIEESLRGSEAKWRNLFEILPVGVSVVDSNRKITEFNGALCEILELSPEELLSGIYKNRRYLNTDYSEINFQELPSIRTIRENKTVKEVEVCIEIDDGTRKWVTVNAAPIPDLNSSIVATIDISQRKQWEEEIQNSKNQVDQLHKHINEVREEERSVIAREIHDELGQTLASLKLELIGIKEDFEEQLKLKRKINKAIELVNTSIKTIRKISSALRPQMLDELGLASAIEWLSNDFKKRLGIKCTLDLQDIDDPGGIISISLFRIFQAALTNVMLHSGARSIQVKLALNNGLLVLSLKDDGIGIAKELIRSPKSFGIVGMEERAKQINGTFEIHSEINKGTEIRVTVPFTDKTEAL